MKKKKDVKEYVNTVKMRGHYYRELILLLERKGIPTVVSRSREREK